MGIQAVPRPEQQAVPKAVCPKCHRPIAMLKSGKCAYCGETVPGLSKARELVAPGAPELQVPELQASVQGASRARLIWQVLAFIAMALLVGGVLMGACMKS